ncbi:hypothetical protein CW304_24245 [Bacillus sp. UFRGS-B20]|nr:hypothetical protein CW304_24245 [Bacillus sp. UFRGS-B20]
MAIIGYFRYDIYGLFIPLLYPVALALISLHNGYGVFLKGPRCMKIGLMLSQLRSCGRQEGSTSC